MAHMQLCRTGRVLDSCVNESDTFYVCHLQAAAIVELPWMPVSPLLRIPVGTLSSESLSSLACVHPGPA